MKSVAYFYPPYLTDPRADGILGNVVKSIDVPLLAECSEMCRQIRTDDVGGMAEWTMAVVLKTTVVKATGGSNPSPSALHS